MAWARSTASGCLDRGMSGRRPARQDGCSTLQYIASVVTVQEAAVSWLQVSSLFLCFLDEIIPHSLRGCSCGSRGFLEDRMMDIITGRAPHPARAESQLLNLLVVVVVCVGGEGGVGSGAEPEQRGLQMYRRPCALRPP